MNRLLMLAGATLAVGFISAGAQAQPRPPGYDHRPPPPPPRHYYHRPPYHRPPPPRHRGPAVIIRP